MSQALLKKAVEAIHQHGVLLTFPIKNKKEPLSLWSTLYPRSEMKWEWNEDSDARVAQLWHLREQLSRSRDVVYSKWYLGRATFFSLEAFGHLLSVQKAYEKRAQLASREAQEIIEALEMDSPLSTRQIKEVAELKGKSFEALYNRVMKELWLSGLIVGFGEIEDSSFPSLAIGATSVLFEDVWNHAKKLKPKESKLWLEKKLSKENVFFKALEKRLKDNHL